MNRQHRKRKISVRKSPVKTRSFTHNKSVNTNNLLAQKVQAKTDKMAEQKLLHAVYTNNIEIPKFSGEPEDISLEDYIARIETLIVNKGLQTDDEKIQTFKAHINPEKGSARHMIRWRDFEERIKKYNKYLDAFRKQFTQVGEREPLRVLVSLFNMRRNSNETYPEYICRLDNFTKQIETNLKSTTWTENGHPEHVSLKTLGKILTMARLVTDCTGNMAEKLYKDLTSDTQLSEINCMIKEYLEKDPQSNQYILPVRAQLPSSHDGRYGVWSKTQERMKDIPAKTMLHM